MSPRVFLFCLSASLSFFGVFAHAQEGDAPAKVVLPARLMMADEVLREIHAQTGLRYAHPAGVLVRQIDASRMQPSTDALTAARLLADRVELRSGTLWLEAELTPARLAELTASLEKGDLKARRVAAYELGITKSTRAIAPLIKALADTAESVRHHALRALHRLEADFREYSPAGRVSIFESTPELATPLHKAAADAFDKTCNEWIWVAEIIGRAKLEDARDIVAGGVDNDYLLTRTVSRWAINRLEKTRTVEKTARAPLSTDTLLEAYTKAANNEERGELLLKLGRAGGTKAWDLILAQLPNPDSNLSMAAIRALERCPEPRATTALLDIMLARGEQVPGRPAEYRPLAAMTLGMIGSEDMIVAIEQYLATAESPLSFTSLALAWSESPRAEQALLACLKVKDGDKNGVRHRVLRSYAYEGLARLGTAAAVAGIAGPYNAYDNVERYVGHAAMRMAGRHQGAVEHAIERLRNSDRQIWPHVLEEASDPRAVDALVETLPSAKGNRLLFGLQALGRIGDPAGVPTLIALLNHETPWVRYEAMRTLRWRWHWHRPEVRAALAAHPTFKAFVEPPPSLENQPENTWVCRSWPIDLDDDRICNTSYEAGMAFDESTGMIVKSNAHGGRCDTPQLSQTWLYDSRASLWRETKAAVVPFGMCGTWNITYNDMERKVVMMQVEGAHHGYQPARARALRPSSIWLYDGLRERWTSMQPLHLTSGVGLRGFGSLTSIPGTSKVFLHGSEWENNSPREHRGRSWLYDVYDNSWSLLPASEEGPGPQIMTGICYLEDQRLILMSPLRKGGKTWLCDPVTGQWRDARAQGEPPALPLPLRYDPISRTALSFVPSRNGAVIWRYDPAANHWRKLDSPVELSPHHDSIDVVYDSVNNLFVMGGGHLGWATDHIGVREVWTYRAGNRPANWQPPARPAPPARVEPPYPLDVTVSVLPTRGARVRWSKSEDARVVGYNIYASTVEVGKSMHHKSVFSGKSEDVKLNAAPVTEAQFDDERELARATGLFDHEIRAYHVRAVDANGRESGPSATVLTLASPVPGVTAEEQPDGSTLVRWGASPEEHVRGYAVYRMDEFNPTLFIRITPALIKDTRYVDWCETPKAERRRYYVLAVDTLGQEGIPSNGAWSFGRP